MESPPPLNRPRDGRILGGVCAGLAAARGVPVGAVRALFVAAALLGGIGVVAYVAFWLIVPGEDERGGRAIVALVLAGAAVLGLGTLAAAATAATVFGFGWAVVAVAAAALVAGLAQARRLGPSWALLPVAALALPSVAIAVAGVRVAPQAGDQSFAPATVAEIPHRYTSGLGMTMIDLRHTDLRGVRRTTIRVDGGLRRTIVALPHEQCVAVDVVYHVRSFAARAANVLLGGGTFDDGVYVFGHRMSWSHGSMSVGDARKNPLLRIEFSSAGGSLYVRDYPEKLDPQFDPGWPQDPGYMEPQPDLTDIPEDQRKEVRAEWKRAHTQYLKARRTFRADSEGPCLA